MLEIFALSALTIGFLAVWLVASLIGVAIDRDGHEEIKWYILVGGILTAIIIFWSDWTFKGAWDTIRDGTLWKWVGVYVATGLGYSVIEFFFGIRKAAKHYAGAWAHRERNSESVKDFVKWSTPPRYADYVELEVDLANLTPQPKINKEELLCYVGAWTLWWPFYAVNLVLGDFLKEVCRTFVNILVSVSQRFVRFAFKDSFT